MDNIKLRAWDEANCVMHYDFQFIRSGTEGNDWIIFTSDKQPLSSDPHPFHNPHFQEQFKIMRWTGLKDRKGKEIYEGDILKAEAPYEGDDNTREIVVKWHEDGGYVIEWDNGFNGGDSDMTLFGWAKLEDYQFEVIGNIYEPREG